MDELEEDNKRGVKSRIRIRGPSGSGKTKACLDISRVTPSIYIDWSRTDTDIVEFTSGVAHWSEEQVSYNLAKLYVARFLVCKHLMEKCSFSQEDWLHFQLYRLGV